MASITDLPPEILSRIFQFYAETENQIMLVKCVSSVTESWKNVCFSSAIWRKFDGTLPFSFMLKLCRKGSLSITKELVISENRFLQDCDAQKLFSSLTNLEIVNFSQLDYFSKNVLTLLAESGNKLKEIQIGKDIVRKNPHYIMHQELGIFFAAKGHNLTAVKISHCTIKNCKLVLSSIAECCPNLKELHLRSIICPPSTTFRTSYFQQRCPKLNILHLDSNISTTLTKHPPGFPNLEVFSYVDQMGYSFTDKHLECILFNSPDLKFLSLAGCAISAEVVSLLLANSVEYLYFPRSKIVNDSNLSLILKKWCHSLKQVDISYSNARDVNKAVLNLITIPTESRLEFLDLSFTQITANVVHQVSKCCTKLEVLCLEGCRNLFRGMKRTYRGESELKVFFEKLRGFISADSDDEILLL